MLTTQSRLPVSELQNIYFAQVCSALKNTSGSELKCRLQLFLLHNLIPVYMNANIYIYIIPYKPGIMYWLVVLIRSVEIVVQILSWP